MDQSFPICRARTANRSAVSVGNYARAVGPDRAAWKGDGLWVRRRATSSRPAFGLPSPLEHLEYDKLRGTGADVWLKRDDLIHPDMPGNKWRKLKYNLAEAANTGERTLLTFGGAYSNHIRATAAAGHYCGFATIGIIRGEPHTPLKPVLAYAVQHGMRLSYLHRDTYRRKTDPRIIDRLRDEHGPFYLLPEGGSNELAVRGCAEIPAEIEMDFDVICCPVGLAGRWPGSLPVSVQASMRSGSPPSKDTAS